MKRNISDLCRYLISIICIVFSIFKTIDFVNCGSNYEQAIFFRPLCIALAIVVLVNMEFKNWFNKTTLIYLPLAAILVTLAYKMQWIFDVNDYQHLDVIRMGKVVIVLWGLILTLVCRYIIVNKSWMKLKECYRPTVVFCLLYFLGIILLWKHYTELVFIMVEFIGFIFVMKDDDKKKKMLKIIIDAIIVSFAIVMYKCLRHRPFDLERYDLVFNNSNNAGTYIAAVVIAFFVRIHIWWAKKDEKKALRIIALSIYYILLGFAISVAMFNYTRTTLAGLIFAFGVSFILSLIRNKKLNEEKSAGIWLRYGLVVVALLATFNITYLALRYVPSYFDSPVLLLGESESSKIIKGDPVDSPKYTTMGSYMRTVFGKWGILIKFDEDSESAKQEEDIVLDGRDVTGGRMEIWALFISNFNLTGRYPFHLYDENGTIVPHSHNSYFMMTHMLGIIVGVIYALFILTLFLTSAIKYLFTKDSDGIYLMAFLFVTTCMISQVSEWISRPQHAFYMIFIMIAAMVVTFKKDKKN